MKGAITNIDIKNVIQCPWCGGKESERLYNTDYNCEVKKCANCGFVYADKILNASGMEKYWKNYASQVHLANRQKNEYRERMYELESEFIERFIDKNSSILDIGCGEGGFLDCFKQHGFETYGVELGEEAACLASEKGHTVWQGEFPKLDIIKNFDCIVFRGSIQYLENPKSYFLKGVDLLKKGGVFYITSSPNSDSVCFNLFRGKFRLPVSVTDYYMYSEKLLTVYFKTLGLELLCKKNFYEETPYANVKDDASKVKTAIQLKSKGEKIDFRSPAYYDNMLTLVYIKVGI